MNKVEWNTRIPPKDGMYLTQLKSGTMLSMRYCDGWNCRIDWSLNEIDRSFERDDVVAWMELPERWRENGTKSVEKQST